MTELTRRSILAGTAAVVGSVGSTSTQAAAPPTGKQAPGVYRYKVGSHEVTVLTDGARMFPLTEGYVTNAPIAEVRKAVEAAYLPPDKMIHHYAPIVVNTGAKLILIDTGSGPGALKQTNGELGQLPQNLAAAGIKMTDIDTVVISHFHGDHVNGLLDENNKLAFPNAEVLVPATEWKFWMDDGEMNKGMGNPILEGNFKNARRVFDALGRKVTPYESGKELAPGITSVASPGHTPGHSSFVVASGSDKVLMQVDITAGAAFLFVKNPEWQLAFDVDKPLGVQTRRKLYDMAIAEKMPIQAFHAAFPGLVRVEKDGSGYRWVPTIWNASL
jgi:glyoxylase-like metal-dependent hydrolase (beta-lactamase superfamily II)